MRRGSIAVMIAVLAVLGALSIVANRATPPPEAPRPAIWSVAADDLKAVRISLAAPARSEAWIRLDDRSWHFDAPGRPPVDARRWSGGIPLLLSGPKAERLIASGANPTQLAAYGLANPTMKIELTPASGGPIAIEVGDGTPDGNARYVKLKDNGDVYAVHHSWFDVIERLVVEPPYLPTSGQP